MTVHAFLDESQRRNRYLLCAALCTSSDLTTARKSLTGLRKPGQRRIHFATESDRRRRRILTELSGLRLAVTMYMTDHPDQRRARAAVIQRLATDLDANQVRTLTIESRQGQDHADRASVYGALGPAPSFEYRHLTPYEEPLLWVPDAIAWAYGKSNDWRRLLDKLDLVAGVVIVETR